MMQGPPDVEKERKEKKEARHSFIPLHDVGDGIHLNRVGDENQGRQERKDIGSGALGILRVPRKGLFLPVRKSEEMSRNEIN